MLAEIAVADPAAFAALRNSKICPIKSYSCARGIPSGANFVTRRFYVMLEIIKSRKNEEIKLAAKLVDSASFRREKVCLW